MKDYFIRPSLKPLAHICPSAVEPTKYRVDRPTEARGLGNANHRLLAKMVHVGAVPPEDIKRTAEAYECDPLALAELYANGCEAWETLQPFFPEALVEFPMPTGGTSDVFQPDLDEDIAAVVLDWKKRNTADTRVQVLDYCNGAREHMWSLEIDVGNRVFKGVAVYCETGGYDVWDFTPEDFDIREEMETRIRLEAGKVFNPGEHCAYCPRFHKCDVRVEEGVRGMAILTQGIVSTALKSEQAAELYLKVGVVAEAMMAYKRWLRAVLTEADTTLDLGNGKEVYIQKYVNRSVDPMKAWPVLQSLEFSEDEMNTIFEMGLTRAKKIIRAKHDKETTGMTKKAAEALLMSTLNDAGAITVTDETKLGQRKRKEPK